MGDRPNILLMIGEHHTAGELSSCGSLVQTPHLDRLAADGVHFDRARTPTPLCGPARAALMSSLYPHANGVWNNPNNVASIRPDLFPGVQLWSELLHSNGYDLGYLGKWHVSGNRRPNDVGWRELGSDVPVQTGWRDIEQRTTRTYTRPGYRPAPYFGTTRVPAAALSDTVLTDRAVEFIRERDSTEQPWAMCIGYMTAHAPYVALPEYLERYDVEEMRPPAGYGDSLLDKPNLYRRLYEQNWAALEWNDIAQMIRHRFAMLSYLDNEVGRVLAALDESGQRDDTLVIYTADHGDLGGAHGLFNLGVPAFDQSSCIPLVLRWPKGPAVRQPGCDELVSLLDVGPTLLEATGSPTLRRSHGRSLLPLLDGPATTDWPQDFYGEFLGHESLYTQRQIVTRDHKFVWNSFDFDELYDRRSDPDELVNQRSNPEYASVLRDLVERLWRRAIDLDDVILAEYPMNGVLPYGPGMVSPDAGLDWCP